MDFIHRQNIERFRKLLARVTDEEMRRKISKLLAEEEAKDHQPLEFDDQPFRQG